MTLTIIIGIAGLLSLAAAATGVVIDKEGKPSILIKSALLRGLIGVAGVSILILSVYMWNKELANGENTCKGCAQKIQKLERQITKLESEANETRTSIHSSISQAYDESANFLIRVAMLIGKKANLGCAKEIDYYQKHRKFRHADQDVCDQLKLLMHPVVIEATNGVDLTEIVQSLAKSGIPALVSNAEGRPSARNENLAIFYPDGLSKDTTCKIVASYEAAFLKKNPSSQRNAIRYALTLDKLGSIQKGQFNGQSIQLGVDITKYAIGVKEITKEDWQATCNWEQEEFDAFIDEKSSNIIPPPEEVLQNASGL